MKTKEELNTLKEEVETMSKKLHELTEEELAQVSGGLTPVLGRGFEFPAPKIVFTKSVRTSLSEWVRPAIKIWHLKSSHLHPFYGTI